MATAVSRLPTMRLARAPSLSLRLAGVFGLLAAASVLFVAGVAVVIARSHLDRTLDRQLISSAASFQAGPATRVRQPAQLAVETRHWLAEHPLPEGQMAAIGLPDGRLLTSAAGGDLYEVGEPRALLNATHVRWWNLQGSEGGVRGLTVPILAHGGRLGTLILLAYERPQQRTLHALVSGIAIASAVGILLSLLLGFAVVRRSLRPLRTMAAEVGAIEAAGDLSRRLSLHGPPDEVGRLADSFDSMLERLEEAFHKQRRFLAEASHELRTPLTVVRGQLEVLADELDGRRLTQVGDELERMSRIVDDLLLLAHLDEGMVLRREPVELELVLREALLRGMLLAPRDIRVDAEPVVYARADAERLLQVTSNLVTNAIKHTPEDGHITLRSERVDGAALIHVDDDGCGIPPDELPHVFERFYRGTRERATLPDGSGLGLAIAHSLVAAMDGTLEVRSKPALATTFTVRLPAA